jgi:hypothetical protein
VSFAAKTLCVASRMFIVVYFVIDSLRKLLDTPSYSAHFVLLDLIILIIFMKSTQLRSSLLCAVVTSCALGPNILLSDPF